MQLKTAAIGIALSAIAGMLLVWGVLRFANPAADSGRSAPEALLSDHSTSPLPITEADPAWGRSDALVTIVQFGDLQCPLCLKVNDVLEQIKTAYPPEQVRLVWKHNPLPFHKDAPRAHAFAAAVFALEGNEGFWKFYDLALRGQEALTEQNLEKWATAAGAEPKRVAEELNSKRPEQKIAADLELAAGLNLTATPTFFFNGQPLSGAHDLGRFKAMIDEQLASANALLAAGKEPREISLALTKQKAQIVQPPPPPPEFKLPPTVWHVPVLPDDPVWGPKDAPVTIVVWSEFQCRRCTDFPNTMKLIEQSFGKDVRVVWKDRPLMSHPQAAAAAGFARAAYDAGGDALFWSAHDQLFSANAELGPETFMKIGKALGLSASTVRSATAGKYKQRIDKNLKLASELEVDGVPYYFVNGKRMPGAQSFSRLAQAISAELQNTRQHMQRGIAAGAVYDELMKTAKVPSGPEQKLVPAPGPNHPTRGSAQASIVIHEFADFACPFCRAANAALEKLLEQYGADLQLVWHHLPLPSHQNANLAAQAAQEAFAQKGSTAFWKYHDKLFENQQAHTRSDLVRYAAEVGLDQARFEQALDNQVHAAHVESDFELARKLGVGSTPGFFINGYPLEGAQPLDRFQALIALSKKTQGTSQVVSATRAAP